MPEEKCHDKTIAAKDIDVSKFRQIFHWPLSLKDPVDPRKAVEKVVGAIGSNWVAIQDRPDAYEEGVYFHDTVQDFLYPKESEKRQTFKRDDITSLNFTIDGKLNEFRVERLTLDLFSFGAAVITLEIVAEAPGTLTDVQTIIDHGRRAFPGFWKGGDDNAPPGLCPSAASLTMGGKTQEMSAPLRSVQRDHWRKNGLPMIFPWWRALASPLVMAGEQDPANGQPEWRHVLDERIPVMSYISVTKPPLSDQDAYDQIGKGDWFRIAGADQQGPDPMPYNENFLLSQERGLFYDRFHADGKASTTTRQCYAGYHFAMVGSGEFFDNFASEHFRTHYRQMNFIAHMEFAALLTFSRRISDLVRTKHVPKDEAVFRENIHALQAELLAFTHLYTFTDVSNHLQAREMNRMLRDAMGLEALRTDVKAELTAASDFAMAAETREATQSQTRLTEFASLFLPATLATGFGGMNLLAGLDQDEGATLVIAPALAQFAVWIGLAYGIGALFLGLIDRKQRVVRWSWCIAAGALAIAALVWVWETRHGTPFWPDWPALRGGLAQNLDQTGGNDQ